MVLIVFPLVIVDGSLRYVRT